jgi:hypothetical protein
MTDAHSASPTHGGDRGGTRKVVASGKRALSSRKKNSSQHFAVADGRDALGTVDLIDGMYVATDAGGKFVGKFASMEAAAASFTGKAAAR